MAQPVTAPTLTINRGVSLEDHPQKHKKQLTIKLSGKQHTVKRGDDGKWLLPLRLSSNVIAAMGTGNEHRDPDEKEAFDVASMVVTDMIEDGYGNIPTEMINQAAKSAVSGAYGFMLHDGSWKKPSYLMKVKQWHSPPGPTSFIQLEATVRGIQAANKIKTYQHSKMDTPRGISNNIDFLKMNLNCLGCLEPICDPPRVYMGEHSKAVSKLMESKIGWPHSDQTLMEFILDDKEPTETRMVGSYADLCFWLLAETSPDEGLHQQALERLDSIVEDERQAEFIEHILKEHVKIMDGTAHVHTYTPNIDCEAYERAVEAIVSAKGRPISQKMREVLGS